MEYSIRDWHNRYQQQSHWTHNLRQYLYTQIDIGSVNHILDVGCGTGVLEAELTQKTKAGIVGIDIDLSALNMAAHSSPSTRFILADGHHLPHQADAFDLVICHFLLLWVQEPLQILREMFRVIRTGGAVLAIAEPDYGGRVDFPIELESLGICQIKSLQAQGANPKIGRQLPSLFIQAGFSEVESGVLGGQWSADSLHENHEAEWNMLEYDLYQLGEQSVKSSELRDLEILNRKAYQSGERVLFVPTFYAWGRKMAKLIQ
ncbi:MAG: class I SAM-dependent methyltransferase [Anaerolineales bacterium]|nr:MAG: class I SAM-dependent methyltransferase [Anaerolineales bacterium]